MEPDLRAGAILSPKELSSLARRVRVDSGDKQEDTAARLGIDQSQVSKAENGDESYASVCVRMIRLYTTYDIKYPLFRIVEQE